MDPLDPNLSANNYQTGSSSNLSQYSNQQQLQSQQQKPAPTTNPAVGRTKSSSTPEIASTKSTNSSAQGSPAGPRFQCSKCSKNFSRIENLTRHQANHDDVGKFACSVCRKRFTRSDLLKRHIRIHPTSQTETSKSHVTQIQFGSVPSPSNRELENVLVEEKRTSSSLPRDNLTREPVLLGSQQHQIQSAIQQLGIPSHVVPPFPSGPQHSQYLPSQPSAAQSQGLTHLIEAALAPTDQLLQQRAVPSHFWDNGLLMGLGSNNPNAYMGSYDADITWALDSYNAESLSNTSSEYDMMNPFEQPNHKPQFMQYPSRRSPPPPDNPIDAAENEDEDTNDWPDKVKPSSLPRRAPRIVPIQLLPMSWQPILEEANARRLAPASINLSRQHITSELRKSLIESLNGSVLRDELSPPEISDAMFPPPAALDFLLQLYFRYLHPRFPVLHLPTFNIHSVPPLLLVSMMLLGSSHSNSDRGRFARIFYRPLMAASIRGLESDSKYLRTVDNIMSFFLLCLAGTWSGSKDAYEFAEGVRGVLVTACRRMRLLDCRPAPLDTKRLQDAGLGLAEATWIAWVDVERGKRLGLSIYLYDCQYPSLFNNQHYVSKAETTNCVFPCDEPIWEAPTVAAWESLLNPNELPKPEYWLRALNCCLLRRYIKPAPPIINTGEFGKILLLYAIHTHIFDWRQATCMLAPTGLMGITAPWDMGNPLRERRIWLLNALDSWAECYQDAKTSTAACLLHRLGYIAIDINLSDMHLVAGRSNNQNDGNFAEQNLKHWANSETATSTMVHIYGMLQICHHRVQNGLAAEASYEIAVCLFTGGIVCWAFAKLNEEAPREQCMEEVHKASIALRKMGCWRMCATFARLLNGFETNIGR